MGKLRISQSAGLHEWLAEQKGYFKDEGLDYEIVRNDGNANRSGVESLDHALPQVKSGAFESIEAGRTSDVSFACHWAVNMAASGQKGQMWGHAYMLTTAGIMVAPESPIRKPEDLRGVDLDVTAELRVDFTGLKAGSTPEILFGSANFGPTGNGKQNAGIRRYVWKVPLQAIRQGANRVMVKTKKAGVKMVGAELWIRR